MGDRDYKDCVISTPEINHIRLDGTEEFLILGCDGLWDEVEPQRCVDIFKNLILSENPSDIDSVSQKLVKEAKDNGSGDNITVVTVLLKSKEELKKTYSAEVKMNGTEDPTLVEPLATNGIEHDPPVLEISPMAEPSNPNMELLESESPILGPKSPVSPVQPILIESSSPSKSPSKQATKTTSRAPLKSATPGTKSTPRSSLLTTATNNKTASTAKSPAKPPVKATERVPISKPPSATQPAKKIGVSVTKTNVQIKTTTTTTTAGVSKPAVPKTTTTTTTTRPIAAAKTALVKKPLKPDETEKSTTLKAAAPPKTRPTTAPSTSSRLAAAKAVTSNSSVTSKTGGDAGSKTESTVKSRNVPTSARSTAPTATTRVTSTTTTQRQPPTSARPLPKTQASTTSTKPIKSTATTTTTTAAKSQVSKPPTSKPPVSKAGGVGSTKLGASRAPPVSTQASKKSPATSTTTTTTTTRPPIRKPPGLEKKVNGQPSVEKIVPPKIVKDEVEKVVDNTSTEASKVTNDNVAVANETSNIIEPIANGDIITNTESFMVTTPYQVAENITDNIADGVVKEDSNLNDVEVNEIVEKRSVSNEVESSAPPAADSTTIEKPIEEDGEEAMVSRVSEEVINQDLQGVEEQEKVPLEKENVPQDENLFIPSVPEAIITSELQQQQEEQELLIDEEKIQPVDEQISQDDSTKNELRQDELVGEKEERLDSGEIVTEQSKNEIESSAPELVEQNIPEPQNTEKVDLMSEDQDTREDITQEIAFNENVEGTPSDAQITTAIPAEGQESKSVESLISGDNNQIVVDSTLSDELDNQQQEQSHFVQDNQTTDQLSDEIHRGGEGEEEKEKQQQHATINEPIIIEDSTKSVESVESSLIDVVKSEQEEETLQALRNDNDNVEDNFSTNQIPEEPSTILDAQNTDSSNNAVKEEIQQQEIPTMKIETNQLIDEQEQEQPHQLENEPIEVEEQKILDAQEHIIISHDDVIGEELSVEISQPAAENQFSSDDFQNIADEKTQDDHHHQNMDIFSSTNNYNNNNNNNNNNNGLDIESKPEELLLLGESGNAQETEVKFDTDRNENPFSVGSGSPDDSFSAHPQQAEGGQNPFSASPDYFSTQQQLIDGPSNPFSAIDDSFSTQHQEEEQQHGEDIISSPSFGQNPFGHKEVSEEFNNRNFDEQQNLFSLDEAQQQEQGSTTTSNPFDSPKEYPSGLPPGCVLAPEFVPREFVPKYDTFNPVNDPFSGNLITGDEEPLFSATTTTATSDSQVDELSYLDRVPPSQQHGFNEISFTNGKSENGVSNGDTKLSLDKSGPEIDLGGEINKTVLEMSHGKETSSTTDEESYRF